ncbi:poly(ADP-ribose) glycohydrolase [Anoplophora glabripennis]|uniref:poly(ADP-ribose) glycohydrolase n=1 Tax=Anoplophora glabripennis TaxID=217634 RepID=UPI00087434E5|nr:poly(ADP-ribose) glycohydrolase [Anoplophora glabripennis]
MEVCDDMKTKSWLGTSISDLCKGRNPWSFSVSPVHASKYHAVLYNLPVTFKSPPAPFCSSQPQHWDEDHVRMPYSEKNLFPIKENGTDVIKIRWNLIRDTLSRPIKNSRELETAITSYNSPLPRFLALHYFFEEILSTEEAGFFFNDLLPKIIKLALRLPEIVPGSFPLLRKNHNRSVSLSQLQISCLLANAFLCTFPWRKDVASTYPGVNFVRLYAANSRPKRQNCVSEKLKCLIHYFRRVTSKVPFGVITFERKFIPRGSMPRWDVLENNLGNTKIHINSFGTIEDDGLGFLQVDFANKNVGGGVLGYGCVQEEIRFVICPELIISRLFVEQLGDHEAVVVTGPERYSRYSGYGDTFKWEGNVQDSTPHDEYGRRRTSICIIDATHFNKPIDQFYPSAILRELNKAYVGFSSREKDNLAPVATGNWGCGAFRGSSALKSIIQLMACSAAGRDMVYFSFGDEELRDELYNMHLFLANNRVTITQLWRFLCGFATLNLTQEKLYAYIQQAFFDGKKQPTIKKFFGITNKKKESEIPSTSNGKRVYNTKKKDLEKPDAMDYVDDDDIIPPTPPNELLYKRENVKFKIKASNEDVSRKLPKTDIAELIDIIDGNMNKPKVTNREESFLMEVDKLRRNSLNSDTEASRLSKVGENEKVDVNESVNSESPVLSSPTAESKSTKRKITDYFQIKSSKSS